MRCITEAEQLEGLGRSLSSLPTQKVAQMAVEAGPSMLGGREEPARKKLCPTMGGKAPQEGILMGQQGQETLEVMARDSCPP